MGMRKIATRESYGNALAALGKEHKDIVVLDADLAGATKTSIFKNAFPDRHYDCGVAEADMMCVAAGLSTTGLVPLHPASLCLQPAEPLSRCAIPLAIPI